MAVELAKQDSIRIRKPQTLAIGFPLCLAGALSLAALAGVKIGPLSRIADPARTFVILNSAAMVAFINFVTGRKAVWVR